jgi:hypothetical protein
MAAFDGVVERRDALGHREPEVGLRSFSGVLR